MEKALLVRVDTAKGYRKAQIAADEATRELNEHLQAGWRVKTMQPTSGAHSAVSYCLVILTKES